MTTLSSKRSHGSMQMPALSIAVINNVDHVESLLEDFFVLHSNFLWDKAREFIEQKRDTFRAAHQSNVSSILASLMNALSQLTLADKNYLTLQFFSTKVFQRKDSVKSSYDTLKAEFQRLEERGSFVGQPKSNSLPQTPHHQSYCQSQSQAACGQIQSEQAQDVLNVEELFMDENTSTIAKTPSPTPRVESPIPISTPKSQSFLSKFFRFKSSSNTQSSPVNINANNSYDSVAHSVASNGDDTLISENSILSRSELNSSLESLDRFAAHLSGQLIHYVRARIEMVELYEQLSSVSVGKKFCIMDECLATLETIHTNADRSFHHPVLNRLKAMFMFECDILLSLLRSHCYIQKWKFLDSLFGLQDAHNKLNMMANLRDSIISQLNNNPNSTSFALLSNRQSLNPLSPLVPGSALSGPSSAAIRRNFTNSSLSSSGSSNLSVPAVPNSGPNGMANTNHSPNPIVTGTNFIFPSQYPSALYPMSASGSKRNNPLPNMPTMPLLIQWLNRFKLFLLSKYTFYFHSLLIVHLAPSSISSSFTASLGASANHNSSANYAQIEGQIKSLCTKHLYDFHTRIVNFIKKLDSSYLILIYNSHHKNEFSLSGYRSPYYKKELPQGVSSYPIIYSYPGEFPKNRMPSLIMILHNRANELNSLDTPVIEYDKPSAINSDSSVTSTTASSTATSGSSSGLSSNLITSSLTATFHHHPSTYNSNQLPDAAYFLVRPDPNFTLAMICEQKKLDKHDVLIVSFLHEMSSLLKGSKIFASLKNGNLNKDK